MQNMAIAAWPSLRLMGVLLTAVIIPPKRIFSMDILLEDDICSQTPVTCTQHFGNQSSVRWIIYNKNHFVAAKAANLLHDKLIIRSSLSSCQMMNAPTENISCTMDETRGMKCSELLDAQKPVFIQGIFNLSRSEREKVISNGGQEDNIMDTVVKSIWEILALEKWPNYIWITSDANYLKDFSSNTAPVSQLWFTLQADTDFSHRLATLYMLMPEENMNFIVICSTKCILKLLHQAYLFESGRLRSRWLVVPIDGNTNYILHTKTQIKTDNVVIVDFMRCVKHNHPLNQDVLKDYLSLLENVSDTRRDNYELSSVTKISTKYDTTIIANIDVIFKTPNGTLLHNKGYITEDGTAFSTEDLYPVMKYGFNKRKLIVAVLQWPPYVIKDVQNSLVTYSGISIDLLKELAFRLNFSYEFIEPEDQEWGRELDGKWTGLVGLMADKKADLTISPIAVDVFRSKVMDFTVPYFCAESTVILKKPDKTTSKWMTLVSPYRFEVHICVLVSLIFTTVFLFIIEEVNPVNSWRNTRFTDRRRRYGDIFWYHLGALMANGGAYRPHTNSGRTLLTCWWLFAVISAATYSGNLIAFLSGGRERPPFSSLAEMVEQETYQWGTVGGGVLIDILKNSKRSDYKKIWNGLQTDMTKDPDVVSPDNNLHLDRILSKQYAFISDETIFHLWEADHCNLLRLKEEFFLLIHTAGLQKNSIYTDIFSEHILRITESGLVNLWLKHWMPKRHCETTTSVQRVELSDLQSVFYVAAGGVLTALVAVVAEYMCNKTLQT